MSSQKEQTNPTYMKLIDSPRNSIFGMLMAATLVPMVASAANPSYDPGDLVLFVQKSGDSSKAVYVRLGNAATEFRGAASGPGAANKIDFLNIKSELDTAFPGWANDTSIYMGLAAIRSSTAGTTVTSGDPKRTIYISQGRQMVGTVGTASSTAPSVASDTDMSGGGSQMVAMLNKMETLGADNIETLATDEVSVKNPINLGIQGPAFSIFPGGIQQQGAAGSFGSLGPAGTVEYALDLYRILAATGVSGQVAGPLRQGSYEGSVTISSAGLVSFVGQGAGGGSAFDTWAQSYPALDTPAKRDKAADPDNDGLSNLMEFVLNGNPGMSDPGVAPTLDTATSNFVFTFTRRDDSEAGSTLLFQYGSDLAGWTSATIGAASSVVGDATITVNQGATTDAITVSVPKTAAPGGSLFGRLKVTQ
jgi:hypothetical protein